MAVALNAVLTLEDDLQRQSEQAKPNIIVPSVTEINGAEAKSASESRWLIHSPYIESDHQLDLSTLNDENALLARALVKMQSIRPDYAHAPYTESFNWAEVHGELKRLVQETGKTFRETSFYIVAFRSRIPPTTKYEDLGALDKEAHREANAYGGFLKYWFGEPDSEGSNLATCVWRSRPDAVTAGRGPAHRKAARATASMYSFWRIDRHRLVIGDGAESFEFIDWED